MNGVFENGKYSAVIAIGMTVDISELEYCVLFSSSVYFMLLFVFFSPVKFSLFFIVLAPCSSFSMQQ